MNFKFQLSWCFSPVAVIPGITSSYCLELERGTMGHKPEGKVSFMCQVIVQLPRIFCSTWRQRLSSGRANRAELSSDQWRFGILLNRWVLSMFFLCFLWFSMVFLGSLWICLCFGIVGSIFACVYPRFSKCIYIKSFKIVFPSLVEHFSCSIL